MGAKLRLDPVTSLVKRDPVNRRLSLAVVLVRRSSGHCRKAELTDTDSVQAVRSISQRIKGRSETLDSYRRHRWGSRTASNATPLLDVRTVLELGSSTELDGVLRERPIVMSAKAFPWLASLPMEIGRIDRLPLSSVGRRPSRLAECGRPSIIHIRLVQPLMNGRSGQLHCPVYRFRSSNVWAQRSEQPATKSLTLVQHPNAERWTVGG